MPIMIFDGQKSCIEELLTKLKANLADWTDKQMNELTCREADQLIAELKAESTMQRWRRQRR